jgi:hypothetical protein
VYLCRKLGVVVLRRVLNQEGKRLERCGFSLLNVETKLCILLVALLTDIN